MTSRARAPGRSRPARGFTLVELVIVMVLVGVVGSLGARFIIDAVNIYRASVARADLGDQADLALRRVSREVSRALPNSLRPTDSGAGLELVPVVDVGRYRAFTASTGAGDILDFGNAGDASFDVIGAGVSNSAGQSIVIYNLGLLTSDAYGGGNRRLIDTGTSATSIRFQGGAAFPLQSPDQRFFVVTSPVKFLCSGGTLWRYSGYGWDAATIGASTPKAALANDVESCAFSVDAGLANIGSVQLILKLTRNGESVNLLQQVNVDATP